MRQNTKKKLIGVYKQCLSALSFTDDKAVKEHYRGIKRNIKEKIASVNEM